MPLASHLFRFSSLLAIWLGIYSPAVVVAASVGQPAATPWVETEQTRLRLVAAQTGVAADGSLLLGLQVELEPGWKIYWRSPGDSGFPPQFDWTASKNLDGVDVLWPAPKRLISDGVETLGYKDEVVYPLVAKVARPGQPVKLRLNLDYGICKDICVPYNAQLALDLPGKGKEETVYASLIHRFAAMVPATGEKMADVGLSVSSVRLEGEVGKQVLVVAARSSEPLNKPDIIVEADPGPLGYPLFYFAAPEDVLDDDRRGVRYRIAVSTGKRKPSLAGTGVTLTLMDGARAVEQKLTVPGN